MLPPQPVACGAGALYRQRRAGGTPLLLGARRAPRRPDAPGAGRPPATPGGALVGPRWLRPTGGLYACSPTLRGRQAPIPAGRPGPSTAQEEWLRRQLSRGGTPHWRTAVLTTTSDSLWPPPPPPAFHRAPPRRPLPWLWSGEASTLCACAGRCSPVPSAPAVSPPAIAPPAGPLPAFAVCRPPKSTGASAPTNAVAHSVRTPKAPCAPYLPRPKAPSARKYSSSSIVAGSLLRGTRGARRPA